MATWRCNDNNNNNNKKKKKKKKKNKKNKKKKKEKMKKNIYRGYHQANTKLIRTVLYLHYLLGKIINWSLRIEIGIAHESSQIITKFDWS